MLRWLLLLGPWALWLGVAGVEAGWSQSAVSAEEQVRPSKATTERNWHAFWRHHLGEWNGRWTRYTPTGGIKETFASSRHFTADLANTTIVQVNRYRYADGRTVEKEWAYNIGDHSQADGFAHPASQTMRGLALNNGAAAWLIPKLEPNQFALFELFLVDGNKRHSVGLVYGKDGELRRTASIRETRKPQAGSGWSDSVVQVKPWRPKGQWRGEERVIHPDLSLAPVQRADWQWRDQPQTNHFFPDGIILRCPARITAGEAFSIGVIWLVNNDELQTITAHYSDKAHLISVTHQALTPEPSSEALQTSAPFGVTLKQATINP